MTPVSKPKVLIVGAFPSGRRPRIYGGQVSVCLRLLDSAFVDNHRVRTIDTTQISNPPPSVGVRAVLAIWRIVLFARELVFHRPDVVLLFLARGPSVYEKGLMVRMSRLAGVPVMVFPRAGGLLQDFAENPSHARFVRATLGRADLFLCQGITFQRFAIEVLGFEKTYALIIPNWTARDEHLEIGQQRSLRSGPAHRLLFLGWLEEAKGVMELLQSAVELTHAGIRVHLTFAGDGTALPMGREFVATHKLDDHVDFAGWVDGAVKNQLLRESDVFVLPSWSEGLPNAMIEAMSAGLPCVVTDVGMISDFVTDGRDALVVPPRDVSALTAALIRLIGNSDLRNTIAANGHALAKSQFSLESGSQLLCAAVTLAMMKSTAL